MAQYDHADTYIIPPNFAKEGTLFSGEGRSKKRSRSGIGCIGRSPRSYVFTPWNQRNHLCRNHSGVATGHSGCNRNSGGKFVLFSNPVLFLPDKEASADLSGWTVPFKAEPPYTKTPEETVQAGTEKEKKGR